MGFVGGIKYVWIIMKSLIHKKIFKVVDFLVVYDEICITSRQLQNIRSGLERFMVKYHSISCASLHIHPVITFV
jgi:hypothetical protein